MFSPSRCSLRTSAVRRSIASRGAAAAMAGVLIAASISCGVETDTVAVPAALETTATTATEPPATTEPPAAQVEQAAVATPLPTAAFVQNADAGAENESAAAVAVPEPTTEPEASEPAANQPDPTAVPAPTGLPDPTAAPDPTALPDPTATPQPTAAPEPTDIPQPTAVPAVSVSLPSVDVIDLHSGAVTNLANYSAPGPLVLWFWAPH